MRLVLDTEQAQLRAALRDLLSDHATSAHVRAAMGEEPGHDPALWDRLGELGALGLVVPEEHGGSGAGHVERAVAAEELGRVVAPTPFLGSAVLAGLTYFGWWAVDTILGRSLIAQILSVGTGLALGAMGYAVVVLGLRIPEAGQVLELFAGRLRRSR